MEPIPCIKGMEITDEVENDRVERRTLKLFEVPLNISTTFRCSTDDGEFYQDISFRVKGD